MGRPRMGFGFRLSELARQCQTRKIRPHLISPNLRPLPLESPHPCSPFQRPSPIAIPRHLHLPTTSVMLPLDRITKTHASPIPVDLTQTSPKRFKGTRHFRHTWLNHTITIVKARPNSPGKHSRIGAARFATIAFISTRPGELTAYVTSVATRMSCQRYHKIQVLLPLNPFLRLLICEWSHEQPLQYSFGIPRDTLPKTPLH